MKNILLNSSPSAMHFMPDFCGSWRGIKNRVERQTTTSSHFRVRRPWETCSFSSFSASVSALNHQIFTYFVQQRSFLSFCYYLNLKQAFKVKNLVPMTMHQGRCHWWRALYQVFVHMLMQKDPCSTKHVKENSYLQRNFLNHDVQNVPKIALKLHCHG